MLVDAERNRALFRKLEQLLGRAPSHPQPDTVHLFRTLSRRVESVLGLLVDEPSASQRKLLRNLKRLRRHAGRVRDFDVQIAALRKLKIGREAERRSRLMNILSEARATREDEFVHWLGDKRRKNIRRRLARVERALQHAATHAAIAESAPSSDGRRSSAAAKPRSRAAEAKLRTLDPASEALRRFAVLSRRAGQLTADNLHAFRTSCKKVRYVAEMGADERSQRIVEALRTIQVAIGDWHDWDALRATAEEMFGRSVDSALINSLRNLTQAKFELARQTTAGVRRELLAMHHPAPSRRRSAAHAAADSASPPAKLPRRRGPASAAKALHATPTVA